MQKILALKIEALNNLPYHTGIFNTKSIQNELSLKVNSIFHRATS